MTANGFAALGVMGAVLALGACATPEDLAPTSQAAPPTTAPQVGPLRPAYAPPQPAQAAKPAGAILAAKSPHRQYLDQRTGKYYYFDQTAHRYFWEDGTPRY